MRANVLTKTTLIIILCLVSSCSNASAVGRQGYVDTVSGNGSFQLAQKGEVVLLFVDSNDWPGVIRAAGDLAVDVNRVTGQLPELTNDEKDLAKNTVIIGTIGKSPVIDRLVKDGKIDAGKITGKWESFIIAVVEKPLRNVEMGLIIAGSDKRGTIYGIYDLSEQIGVSPWYWWADVPVEHKNSLFIKAGTYQQGPPAVKYRGIFLNDEGFALTPWVREKFGDYNSQFYTKVFELLLRLKANYMWPAMWNNAFNEDDPKNPKLADEYGIVMGNSHQEPMLRAQKEWDRRYHKTWDYQTDANELQKFWREGVRRNKDYESIISMGLRGANDTEMAKNKTVQECMAMLTQIFDVQRKIIAEEVNPDVTKVTQLWCPYKETQEYYDKGFRPPDDITILWCDDNWGNIRRLPTADERKRSGGAGIYYHFDFHGGPRSYEWTNSIQNAKIWEQLNLAYNYGATRIWIVNVGDLKPMEYPIEFFMTFAWNPQKGPKEKISEFAKLWAQREFGPKYADEIADIMAKYTKYHARRKAELLEPATYSITNYREADTVSAEFNSITVKAEKIYNDLPDNYKDAFYQLVLYPAKALATVTDLYIAAAENKLYADQKRASANDYAAKVRDLFKQDAELSNHYNKVMAGGKWNHMMDAIHIGWTSWNPPSKNNMPKVVEINVPAEANMGIAVEGSLSAWPGSSGEPALPQFSLFGEQKRYIDVFNRGSTPFEFKAKPSVDWIVLSSTRGKIDKEQRLWVSIDWKKAPVGDASGLVKIAGAGSEANVKISSFNPVEPNKGSLDGFAEADGCVSIEAEHYTKKTDAGEVRWEKIDDYGRTLSSMTIFPVTAHSVTPPTNSPCLEYKMFIFNPGSVTVEAYLAPSLNFFAGKGLQFAMSFDDQPPQIINFVSKDYIVDYSNNNWQDSVRNGVRKIKSSHRIVEPGYHTLKIWMVDPGVVLQKIIVNTGGVRPSYLGPPESFRSSSPK
ncbi:MAG: glycosyl hydrolase 115 family protein [Sedimentisphaerales bacterium]|nr:glycosyl hydrolase 115 family protein [Sedimentisphaerales bacterium]